METVRICSQVGQIEKCYENLAIAITMNAIDEYMSAQRRLIRNSEDTIASDEKKAAIRFFNSGAFGLMAEIDVKWLCKLLDEKAMRKKSGKEFRTLDMVRRGK